MSFCCTGFPNSRYLILYKIPLYETWIHGSGGNFCNHSEENSRINKQQFMCSCTTLHYYLH